MGYIGVETYPLPPDITPEQAARVFADNEITMSLLKEGLRFGLHNHWWEFEKVDGVYPFYYILQHGSPEKFFEIDTYWIKTAGLDPA
jgi:hypothetical protein